MPRHRSPRTLLCLTLALAACESDPEGEAFDAGDSPLETGDAAMEAGALDASGEREIDGATDAAAPGDAATFADAANAACSNDAREPDNNISEAENHDPVNGITPIELRGLMACPGDQDVIWAGFVDAGGKAGAVLTWNASLGELELSLGDADNTPITHRDVSTASAGRAEERVDEYYDAYFYVRVKNPGAVAIPYTLTVTAQVFGP